MNRRQFNGKINVKEQYFIIQSVLHTMLIRQDLKKSKPIKMILSNIC